MSNQVDDHLEAKAEREAWWRENHDFDADAGRGQNEGLQVGRIEFEPQQHGSMTFPPPAAHVRPSSIKLIPAVDELLGWCKTHSAVVTWREEDVLVKAHMGGTVRTVARPTFRAAVARLIELEAA